jgi:hypothetical protein
MYRCALFHNFWKSLSRVLEEFSRLHQEGGLHPIFSLASALHAEAMAVNRGILYASQMGMTRIIVKMDNTVLAYALKGSEIDLSAVGCLVHQACDLMRFEFSYCNVSICNRCCNKVADC